MTDSDESEDSDRHERVSGADDPRPVIRRNPSYPKLGSAFVTQFLRKIPGFDPHLCQLISHWGEIAGHPAATYSIPEKIIYRGHDKSSGHLQLRVSGSAALDLQHRAPQLCQKINQFFGFRLIEGLQFIQSPIAAKPSAPQTTIFTTRAKANDNDPIMAAKISQVENEELRQSLAALAGHILAEKSS